MGVIQAFTGALGGTFADQWKDIITAGHFDEYTVVSPGLFQQTNRGRGSNYRGSADVISNGSKIFVPENTAAFIFSQAGIEDVIWAPGGYEYRDGMPSVFAGDGVWQSIVRQTGDRFTYGGQTSRNTSRSSTFERSAESSSELVARSSITISSTGPTWRFKPSAHSH